MSCGTLPLRRRRSCLAAVRAKLVNACAEQQGTKPCCPCLITACVTGLLQKGVRTALHGIPLTVSGAIAALRQKCLPVVDSVQYLLHIKWYLTAAVFRCRPDQHGSLLPAN